MQKARAEEKSVFNWQKRKTMAAERKQKKEQKEEAEKHLRLQGELVRIFVSLALSSSVLLVLPTYSTSSLCMYSSSCSSHCSSIRVESSKARSTNLLEAKDVESTIPIFIESCCHVLLWSKGLLEVFLAFSCY